MRKLLEFLAGAPPPVKVKASSMVKAFRNTRDIYAWNKGLDELESMGIRGLQQFRKEEEDYG